MALILTRHQIAAAAIVLLAMEGSALAEVRRIVIDKEAGESPAFGGRTFGDRGQYEKLVGRVYGELDPDSPRNRIIQDMQLAPRNARGRVEYVATFSLIKPVDLAKASGLLFYEAVNRGNELTQRFLAGGSEDGEAFLARRGAVILRSGWQGDIADETARGGRTRYTIRVPVAKNRDGSPILGPVLFQFANVNGNTSPLIVLQRAIPYRPATLDTKDATLTSAASWSNDGTRGPAHTIPSADWAWADCTSTPFPGRPDPTKVCLKDGFDPARLYELVFQARDPLVLGIGFAATRDIVAFLRRARADATGTPSPTAGAISRTIGIGSSQTGQFIRTFIHLGFNEDEAGRVVFDGAVPNIAGRQLGLNVRFSLPDGTATDFVPDGQGPLWWSDWADPVRNAPAAGLLDRCRATNTCPKIFETFGASELWGLRMSPDLVGTTNAADIWLPDNVRRYYFPSAPHGGGPGGFSRGPYAPPSSMYGRCALQANPLPESDTMRALIVALDEWVARGTRPPDSRYPRLSDGSLVEATRAALRFPDIPGVKFVDHLANPQFDYDFGPTFRGSDVSGVLTKLPPGVRHVIPGLVASVDADGNETVGVASVLRQAPLGTYLGWNITTSGFYNGQRCAFIGGYVPFAATRSERLSAHDPRPSLEERYGSHERYVDTVRAAARLSVKEGFLLPEDAERLVAEAAASRVIEDRGRD